MAFIYASRKYFQNFGLWPSSGIELNTAKWHLSMLQESTFKISAFGLLQGKNLMQLSGIYLFSSRKYFQIFGLWPSSGIELKTAKWHLSMLQESPFKFSAFGPLLGLNLMQLSGIYLYFKKVLPNFRPFAFFRDRT